MVDSTPVLSDTDTIKSFLASQQHNSGVIGMLFDFIKLMALHYDHKWYDILDCNIMYYSCSVTAHNNIIVYFFSRAGATLPNVKSFLDLYDLLHAHISYPSPFWWVV